LVLVEVAVQEEIEEGFLTTQADAFTGSERGRKIGPLRSE
jgi:hypothetical protein